MSKMSKLNSQDDKCGNCFILNIINIYALSLMNEGLVTLSLHLLVT